MRGREKQHQPLVQEKCEKIIEELRNQSDKIELKDNIQKLPGSFCFFLYKKVNN